MSAVVAESGTIQALNSRTMQPKLRLDFPSTRRQAAPLLSVNTEPLPPVLLAKADRLGLATGFCRHYEMTTAAAGVGQAAIGALVGQPGQRLGGGGRSWQGA